MSYNNYIPAQWAAGIERDLERLHVYAEDTNRQYEGLVSEQGESVKILGVGKPTIRTIARTAGNDDIVAPEVIEDSSILMPIDQIRYFNYMIGDIDKQLAKGGIMEALNEETSELLSNEVDQYIADLAKGSEVTLITGASAAVITITAANARQTLDLAVKTLYKKDVKRNTKIIATVSPDFYMFLKEAVVNLDTDNSKLLKHGFVGQYGNVYIKMSNNVALDASSNELLHVKTKRAIAYVHPKTHTEPFRPEAKFADAVKGFILFGAKIVRPKEMVAMKVTY